VVGAFRKLTEAIRGDDGGGLVQGYLKPIDTDEIARRLKIDAEAGARGSREQPSTDSQSLDAVEQKIIQTLESEWTYHGSDLINNLRAYGSRLIAVSVQTELVNLHLLAQNTLAKLRDANHRAEAELGPLRETYVSCRDELRDFRAKHKLKRAARTPARRWTNIDKFPRRAWSGNPKLDEAVIFELKKILGIIPVNPAFQYVQEDQPNAFAMRTSDVLGTNGTVLIGLKLLNSLLQDETGGGAAAIAGICAHEVGHIYQYFNDYFDHISPLGTTAVELHADLIAGYYMGRRGDATSDQVHYFSQALFNRTGYDFTDPSFHGSPGERIAAVDKGYFWAKQGVSLPDACTRGEAYVRSLVGQP
jgi:hypothetical protein